MIHYQFGQFNVDPQTVRLSKSGQPIELEPLAFNTLLFLLENRHRVVTKDELFEKVWKARVLTEHVITRIIYQLRKVLDDADAEESCIRTVRGKGYQFVVDVQTISIQAENIQSLGKNKKKYKFLSAGLLLVLALCFFSWLIWSGILYSNKTVENNNKKVYQIMSILPVDVPRGNEEVSILVQSLIDYLSYQLEYYFNMKVIHPDSLHSYDFKSSDIYAIQKETSSDLILQGFIELNDSSNLKLHLILHQKNQDNMLMAFPLGAFEFPYPKSSHDLNALYKQRKVTVKSIVDIIKPGVIIDDNDFETDDPEAYRLAIAAHHLIITDDCEDMKRAEELLLQAVERDEKFVYAYLQLFNNYYKRVWICGESTDYHLKGLKMAEMVDQLAPKKYAAMAMRRSTILVESNQVEEAFEFSKNVDWDSPSSIYDMSYSLRYAGFLQLSAKNIERILQLDPFFFNAKPVLHAPNTLLYLNRFEEYQQLLAEPGNSYHDYFRALSLYLSANIESAEAVLKAVINKTPDDLFGRFAQALLLIIEQDMDQAFNIIKEIETHRDEKKHTDGEMTYKLAQLYALSGCSDDALRVLERSIQQGFFPHQYFFHDPAMNRVKDRPKFKTLVLSAQKRHAEFAQRFGLEQEVFVL